MPKQLIILTLVALCLCAIGGSLLNFQTSVTAKNQREFSLNDNKALSQIDWITVLSQLPQYKKIEIKDESINTPVDKILITDGLLVGIVVDTPKSALVYVEQSESLEPLRLAVGEGWLSNWVIKEINVDSVEWYNQIEQQSYTQMLFNTPDLEQ